ncbi:MAG TPA: hypothetical protein VIW28_13655, partial [Gemmatimonadales bacterium]
MIRKREPRWQSAADRARVASDLIEEAESLAESNSAAPSAEVQRDSLPPPVQVEPRADDPAPPPGTASGPPGPPEIPVPIPDAPAAPPVPGTAGSATAQPLPVDLDRALVADPDDVALLVERAKRLAAASHYAAARRDLERALRRQPEHVDALL